MTKLPTILAFKATRSAYLRCKFNLIGNPLMAASKGDTPDDDAPGEKKEPWQLAAEERDRALEAIDLRNERRELLDWLGTE